MDGETLFQVATASTLAFWLPLLIVPHCNLSRLLVHSPVPVVYFGGLYLLGLLSAGAGNDGGGFESVGAVRQMFNDDHIMAAGWIHYLVFDLFVGAWIARDARRRGIRHLLIIPCLLATFWVGPLGLLSYLALRPLLTRLFPRAAEHQPRTPWTLEEASTP